MEFVGFAVLEGLGISVLSSASTNCRDWDAALVSFVWDGDGELFRSL